MKSVIVIGGGWAGLSCAVHLAGSGYQVTVLEAGKRLGGRASSFVEQKSGRTIDNGQHLFMGCYTETMKFLKTLGTLDKLKFQKNLGVDFVSRTGKISTLSCPRLPSPLHLFAGLLRLDTLSFSEKLGMAKVHRAVQKWDGNGSLSKITVEAWLKSLGQSDRSRRYFWDLITIAALNEKSDVAEADSLAIVLKEAFFGSIEKSQIAISSVGLSDLLNPACSDYLASRGGKIENDKLVTGLNIKDGQIQNIQLRENRTMSADYYVSALPFFALKNILPDALKADSFFGRISHLESSPIFSITLWFDREVMDQEFCALLDTHVQWVFNKNKINRSQETGSCLALVISGARDFMGKSDDEIIKICLEELGGCFPKSKDARPVSHLVQREKNATLSPKVGYAQYRLSQKTPIPNLFLCGDWTDTGYPATIESAVLSGVKASQAIHENRA